MSFIRAAILAVTAMLLTSCGANQLFEELEFERAEVRPSITDEGWSVSATLDIRMFGRLGRLYVLLDEVAREVTVCASVDPDTGALRGCKTIPVERWGDDGSGEGE